MFNPLNYLKALYSFLTLAIEARLPKLPARRAISQTVAIGAVAGIIAIGALAIYYLVVSTGPTTSTYP